MTPTVTDTSSKYAIQVLSPGQSSIQSIEKADKESPPTSGTLNLVTKRISHFLSAVRKKFEEDPEFRMAVAMLVIGAVLGTVGSGGLLPAAAGVLAPMAAIGWSIFAPAGLVLAFDFVQWLVPIKGDGSPPPDYVEVELDNTRITEQTTNPNLIEPESGDALPPEDEIGRY